MDGIRGKVNQFAAPWPAAIDLDSAVEIRCIFLGLEWLELFDLHHLK